MAAKAAVALVLALVVRPGPCRAAWLRHALSDDLGPNAGAVENRQPSASSLGVTWVAKGGLNQALAVWDRAEARLVVGALRVPPPEAVAAGAPGPAYAGPSLWEATVAFSSGPSIGSETEIYVLDGTGVHRVTYNHVPDGHPSLYGTNIAWDNYPPACSPWPCSPDDSEVWFWSGYGAWQVTDNEVDDAYPSLYGLTIAWQSDGNIAYATIPDPEWGRPLSPRIVAQGSSPSLFEEQIAYCASDGTDMEIFLYDTHLGDARQITHNEYDDVNPRLYDGAMVWEGDDGHDTEVFYWDGERTEQLTDNEMDDIEPVLWGSGLNTTIAYAERWWDGMLRSRVICLRPAVICSADPEHGEIALTWPSLEGRTYRVEYSDDLANWEVAADFVPSAGYGTTSWTDGEASGTVPPASAVSRRFYRVCEIE